MDYHVLAAVAENVFLFQHAEGHVHVMVYDLIFTNPFKRRHIFFCFLRADSLIRTIIAERRMGIHMTALPL